MDIKSKKDFLKKYILQEAVISCNINMCKINPQKCELYKQKIKEAEFLRQTIEEKISKIDNPVLSVLLSEKYIFGKTLEEIALILNYSKRHIERLHIKALDEFEI